MYKIFYKRPLYYSREIKDLAFMFGGIMASVVEDNIRDKGKYEDEFYVVTKLK